MIVLFALALFGATGLVGGCEPILECLDECELGNDQCGIGLACFSTTSRGTVCLPDDCEQCFEFGDSCNYSSDTKPDSETLVCGFTGCSN